MKILHVGWGFRPWRPGGLIAYAEDLMAAQVEAGHEVGYFFSGRHYPRLENPRLRRWRRGGVAMREVVNSPLLVSLEAGTRRPDHELTHPALEAAFVRTLEERRPDVVHIQELAGLPSSLIEIASDRRTPMVMTLQDYLPLCPTIRLVDTAGELCVRHAVGPHCVACNLAAPEGASSLIRQTLRYEIGAARQRLPGKRRGGIDRLAPLVERAVARATNRSRPPRSRPSGPDDLAPTTPSAGPPTGAVSRELAAGFQRRRETNVARLGHVERLLAQSRRVREIYVELGVDSDHIEVTPLTVAHLEQLHPGPPSPPQAPLTFATLNGFAAPTKGSRLLLEALRTVDAAGVGGRYRLLVLGYVEEAIADELAALPAVSVRGPYEPGQLDRLLDGVDVGIVPSVWEEAFGYVGLELLAKGIPLLANAVGGIVDYAREGETAWLNRSCSAGELAELMLGLIHRPERVASVRERVRARRDALIVPMPDHAAQMERIYRELIGERSSDVGRRSAPRPSSSYSAR